MGVVQESQTGALLQWSLELMREFSQRRRGVHAIEASSLLQKEKENEQCKDIRALLLLLKNITDRELTEMPRHLNVAGVPP